MTFRKLLKSWKSSSGETFGIWLDESTGLMQAAVWRPLNNRRHRKKRALYEILSPPCLDGIKRDIEQFESALVDWLEKKGHKLVVRRDMI